jgi:hypothetical protein
VSVAFAGERKMIKNFDEQGLKQLNNLLYKQDKLIRKLTKQGVTGSNATTSQGSTSFVEEVLLGDVVDDSVEIVGIPREDGRIEVWHQSDIDDDVSPTPNAYVHETQAKIAVPSSYFLDLRGIYHDTTEQQYTADVAILHDVNGNTITLTNLDETNNIDTAGPVAGGRDQVAEFANGQWVHVFFIYNPITGDVSSVSSTSPTAPTLTGALAGYTFFVRCGPLYTYESLGTRLIVRTYQMNDRITYNTSWFKWDNHSTGYESLDLSNYVPATAKLVYGSMGLSDGTTPRKMAVSSDDSGLIKVGALCDAQGTGHASYGVSGSKDFVLPLVTAQTIWWNTETDNHVYAIGVNGFTDDL